MSAQTGDVYGGGQDSRYGANPLLEIELTTGAKYSAELTGVKTRGSQVFVNLQVGTEFTTNGISCFIQSQIAAVSLVAEGGDGWFVSSIETFLGNPGKPHVQLSSDPSLQKWVDNDEEYLYAYNAKYVPLTLSPPTPSNPNCITWLKISAQTGISNNDPGFSPYYMNGKTHYIQLLLRNGNSIEVLLKVQHMLISITPRKLISLLNLKVEVSVSQGQILSK